uniref:Uncharacterized protein n=1 Tax=Anopheles merus TaxID=30066 RepID=A0A182UNW0_ANOME
MVSVNDWVDDVQWGTRKLPSLGQYASTEPNEYRPTSSVLPPSATVMGPPTSPSQGALASIHIFCPSISPPQAVAKQSALVMMGLRTYRSTSEKDVLESEVRPNPLTVASAPAKVRPSAAAGMRTG